MDTLLYYGMIRIRYILQHFGRERECNKNLDSLVGLSLVVYIRKSG
jgi:hypothetical protein